MEMRNMNVRIRLCFWETRIRNMPDNGIGLKETVFCQS